MTFSYHPPTRKKCEICEALLEKYPEKPLIDTYDGKSSSSNGFPFHNWYNFVLGFTPSFPEYLLKRENISSDNGDIVLDPFNGSGTTQLVCKLNCIPSIGIDANDYMVFAAKEKLDWKLDINAVEKSVKEIVDEYNRLLALINLNDVTTVNKLANEIRNNSLDKRYISDKPLIKVHLLKKATEKVSSGDKYKQLMTFAISSILVPISNVKYGPGFGVGKQKDDVDVLKTFVDKTDEMVHDLKSVSSDQINTSAETYLGDSRHLSNYVKRNSISLIITSPPYPGDHEYTKHSKLELIFQGYASDLASFRTIKKRMIRGSTTNIYKDDHDKQYVADITEIKDITDEIDRRLKHDGATSGFEKLYTKLVWEYFGGMEQTLREAYDVLKPGGKIAMLVSDSHAFKMVHIQTAEILRIIGEKIGFINSEIVLWQLKVSTSHKYHLRENILIMQKPLE